MVSEKIVINASPEIVFEVLRAQRNSDDKRRQLQSFDGKTAIIKEDLEGVPIYGKVQCIWQEVEDYNKRIDFKMLSSTKFKESHGALILTPLEAGQSTTLELQVHLDPGLAIPFASEVAKQTTSRDAKERLEKIKKIAECQQCTNSKVWTTITA